MARWRLEVEESGEQFHLGGWQSIGIKQTFRGAEMSVQVPAAVEELRELRELTSDIVVFRDNVPMYRFRYFDSEDTFTRDAHDVTLACVSYEFLLAKRNLKTKWVQQADQFDLAWALIELTMNDVGLGITRGVGQSGRVRQETVNIGNPISEAINEIASRDGGFDWWIDVNRVWRAQSPRRAKPLGVDLTWGVEVAELTRSSASELYANSVLVVGSQEERDLFGTKYPPTTPRLERLGDMRLGLWEQTFSYPDIVTQASVDAKAAWHLANGASMRPTYSITFEPGIWEAGVHSIGDTFNLRVPSAQRGFQVEARIEEVELQLTADGAEVVKVFARAEQPETVFNSPFQPLPPLVTPTGRTQVHGRIHPADEIAGILRAMRDQISRDSLT